MLLRKQRNIFYSILQNRELSINNFTESREEESYEISINYDDDEYFFYLELGNSLLGSSKPYEIKMRPGMNQTVTEAVLPTFEHIIDYFDTWATNLKEELDTPDLWAEAAKTAQLFAPSATPSDDKFTRAELAEVQGQLRQLQQSFATAALPEAARQKLIALTQTAAVKAEGLTKKDWQNWIIGGFISAITGLALNPTQAAEVLKLVKAAFGGLFLH